MIVTLFAMAALIEPVERPDWIVRPDEAATYGNALQQFGSRALRHYAGVDCPDAAVRELETRPMTVRDVPGASGPIQGLRERVRVDGCGQSSIQNLVVVRPDPAISWRFSFAVPGESILQWIQQDYVLAQLTSRVERTKPQGCDAARLTDTYVTANPGRVVFGQSAAPEGDEPTVGLALAAEIIANNQIDPALAWAELWIFDLCGTERAIGVVMMPTFDRNFIPLPVPMDEFDRSDWPKKAVPKPSGEVSSGL